MSPSHISVAPSFNSHRYFVTPQDVTANKRKMDELEENLLFKLTSIQGPLVDDESLIEVLNVTKITSEEVNH